MLHKRRDFLGEELVDDSVVNASVARHRASSLADSIDLVKDDDVKTRVHTLEKINVFVLKVLKILYQTKIAVCTKKCCGYGSVVLESSNPDQ